MVSGFKTSPYDHDMMVPGEARLIRSAVSPLVSTGSSPQEDMCQQAQNMNIASLSLTRNQRVLETNKGKRFESFSQALAKFLLGFYIQRPNYIQNRRSSQASFVKIILELGKQSSGKG
jgi:hypothetical protein